jgi:hypothetical protein
MRLSFHEIALDVSTEFIAEHISPVFPKGLATRCADKIQVVEIRWFSSCANRCRASASLAKGKMSAGDAPALQLLAVQLALVRRGIEVAVRFRDRLEIISKEQLRF